MNKTIISIAAACTLVLSGCGLQAGTAGTGSASSSSSSTTGNVLGNIIGGIVNGGTTNELLNMVIGSVKIEKKDLVGSWQYSGPGCAFTSERLLAKAGGAVAAAQVKERLKPYFASAGLTSSNTSITFGNDNQFSATIKGIPVSGTYSYNASTGEVQLKTLLLNTNAFVTRTTSGIGLMFESKKLITLLKTAASLSGNSKVEAIGDLASNYDGVRLGMELKSK